LSSVHPCQILLAVGSADDTAPLRVTGLSQEAVLLRHAQPPVNDPRATFPPAIAYLQSVSGLFHANHVIIVKSDRYLMGPQIGFHASTAIQYPAV